MVQIAHQEVIRLGQENQLLKTKSAIDLSKATMDKDIKEKELMLSELETELEYKVKMRELTLQEAELELEKAKIAIDATEAAHKIDQDVHDTIKANQSPQAAMPGPEIKVEGISGQTLK